MGIIKAAVNSVKGALGDQWLKAIEPVEMSDRTVFAKGICPNGKNTIANGSVIHVYDNQFMMLVDGGKIVDYTAEPGYFQVDNSSMPSLFSGSFKDALNDTFERFKFGGGTPKNQQVYYINLQEIKGIRFGTRNPINYFDNFYNSELFLRAHGTYSIKITDPMKFYAEAVPKNKDVVEIDEINEQYLSEFLDALQSAVNQMSADGMRISFLSSKSRELSKYMADTLDDDWRQMRGMEVQSVGLASISYDEESQKLINMRNKGAMMSDPSIREGFVVMPYMYPDLNAARDLVNAGAACVMPLGSPIGSNKGLSTKDFIQILIDEIDLPIIVDAGIGRPSQACEAMEMGASAVMANTAIATAGNVPAMAEAFKKAIEAGRSAYLSGLGRTLERGASASSPLTGFLED